MTTPTDTEMIRAVAKALGWEVREKSDSMLIVDHAERKGAPHPQSWFFFRPHRNPWPEGNWQVAILFAAYVMAALAERGHEHRNDHAAGVMEVALCPSDDPYKPLYATDDYPYDPTDPASWAMAVIRCAWEALKGGNDGTQS